NKTQPSRTPRAINLFNIQSFRSRTQAHSLHFMPKPVGFCLYQEAADPYEVRKPAQVSHHYVAYACIFLVERKIM
ncbi:hypothetical protein MUO69_05240, partial [Candidatus Bathyarchaeota archaeon]|nr:hypothetical protein [Candidatus Bathyarchaeota archaeon]